MGEKCCGRKDLNMKGNHEEELFLQMKNLRETISVPGDLVDKTKKKVWDEDKIYRNVLLGIMVPVCCVITVSLLYYFAYARPVSRELFGMLAVQQKWEDTEKITKSRDTLERKRGQEQEEVTEHFLHINWIGFRRAKISVTTVTTDRSDKQSPEKYRDTTAYWFIRNSKGWKLQKEQIREI